MQTETNTLLSCAVHWFLLLKDNMKKRLQMNKARCLWQAYKWLLFLAISYRLYTWTSPVEPLHTIKCHDIA